MLINFSVRNFGPIKEKQTLSFEADKSDYLEDYYVIKAGKLRLLKLGLIYGANASGKTTVLQALDFLRDLVMRPLAQKDNKLDFTPYLFDPHTPDQPTEFVIEFLQNDRRFLYEVGLTCEYISHEALYVCSPRKVSVFKRTTDVQKQLTEVTFNTDKFQISTEALAALRTNTLWNNTLLGGYLKTNIEQQEMQDVFDWFRNYLTLLILPRTNLFRSVTSKITEKEIDKNVVLDLLKKADFGISDIKIREKETEIPEGFLDFLKGNNVSSEQLQEITTNRKIKSVEVKFEHTVNGYPYELSFEQESLGTQRYYGLAGVLYRLVKKSVLVPIDEVESSLHPDLLIHFLKLFLINTTHSQLIATTHYQELFVRRSLFRNDAIWITDKSENNATELYSLADFDMSDKQKANVLNLYKQGKFGGVPVLGDEYIDIDNETK